MNVNIERLLLAKKDFDMKKLTYKIGAIFLFLQSNLLVLYLPVTAQSKMENENIVNHQFWFDKIFLNMFVKNKKKLTQHEIEYFRMHPSEIDEITAPINVHKVFLTFGIAVGVILVGISKIIKTTNIFDFMQGTFEEFVIDIIFEIGVALIGAGVTAYLLGILMNTQQQNAKKWRKEIRRKIREADQ